MAAPEPIQEEPAALATSDEEPLEDGKREDEPTAAPTGAASSVPNGNEVSHVEQGGLIAAAPGEGKRLNLGEQLLKEIADLKAERKKLNDDKIAKAKALKSKEKQRTRLKNRAKQLSNEDLLSLVFIRDQEKSAKKAKSSEKKSEPTAAKSTSE